MSPIEKKKFWQSIGKSACPDEVVRDLSIKEIKKFIKKNSNVIDIGCGDGFCTFKFLDRKIKLIKGIDFSATSIKNAKKNKDILGLKKKISFEIGDVLNLSKYQNSFEHVITIRCLINLDNKKKQISALKEIYKTLKKGGTYLMCENFNENLENLNKLRKKFNLDKIKTRWHNKYLSNKEIKDYATKKLKFKILEERNFASSYYFLTELLSHICLKSMIKNYSIMIVLTHLLRNLILLASFLL